MPKEVTNEELARMIAGGFDDMGNRFEATASKADFLSIKTKLSEQDQHFKHLDGRLDHLDARMGRMEADLHEIKGNIVYKFEFEDLAERVKYIESKLGIESGK
ncbi:hypothetical protein A3B05_00475 [Candidatus Giovannonibacteria bacterium RIFCSPLOWO2_01_FULL_43_160]|uniref:Uncharacterized protein n=2 Tax=Candidatus Giovannoniibacteriota TaxID=1752738 RepID=A0A0G1ISZ6_9BACT|nr:MAG: hypothetical protein UV72_C0014G0029 [Candidatus Giovannonibacteria bacterium GW2011_GWB1_43_13]KKS99137.1 MAG: hypothetical protein UV75_C0009G0021 [Candidatus Giovannonibacteria bacterium GW2011_GWA1_43_15]KKT21374.1 MAG: hypothetical protein UW05_C0011G0007 [Candidatus Giovannonibacteria bacterium GW2011_GWC2_43_8]KKT62043.1 MAG: hypothetical protein UW55_C0018G0010 [Candidatus Giovannonibacteria bacterium GW2011_GWA2_44_26]OGF58317.1 MAG: hypothetical protein A2652_01260 [Candidatus